MHREGAQLTCDAIGLTLGPVLKLYYYPGNASFTPHVLLNEIGAPFELALVDRSVDAQRSAAYLRLNPNGRIPTLVDGDVVVYETAAIVLYLVDRFPEARLAPPVGTSERAFFYRHIAHLSCTVQPEMRPYFYPEQHVSSIGHAADVRDTAEQRLADMFTRINAQLSEGPYLLGEQYSAADPYLLMLVRWTRAMKRPARMLPNLARHAERVLAREAVRQTFAREGLPAPFV
jgi:glutathione S-transferase